MKRTRRDECFRITGWTTSHLQTEEIQRDLEHSHQGYRLNDHTPAQALYEALGIDEPPAIVPAEENGTMPPA